MTAVGTLRWALLALGLSVLGAGAATFTWTVDPDDDHTGPDDYAVYQLGWRVENDSLEVIIRTNFPQAGDATFGGGDSYGDPYYLPGDLYVNLNGSHNAGTGSVFGLGLTSHSGDPTWDPFDHSLPWSAVTQGNLYSGATFATGTYEGYAYAGLSGSPYDGGSDPYGHGNNLPTLIAGYGSNLGYQGPVTWTAISGQPWAYEIAASINLSTLGATDGDCFELWWAMECGNDAVMAAGCIPPVPEPGTLALLGLGAGILLRRRRRSLA